MSTESDKKSNVKWAIQYVIVPLVVAFIAGSAGMVVIVSVQHESTPAVTPTLIVTVTVPGTILPTETFTRVPTNAPLPTATNTPQIQATNTQPAVLQPTIIPPVSTQNPVLIHGESVSSETLSRIVGGDAVDWKQAGYVVWVYSKENNNTTIRHPGENMVLTYWAGFGDPQNAGDCQIIISPVNKLEKAVKCPSGTNAQIVADQVGLHIVDYTGFFSIKWR